MAGYSAKLPLSKDSNDGFTLLKTLPEVAAQNFRMLLLTEPGERVWDANYGVGIKRYLFENEQKVKAELPTIIQNQTRTYLPYIRIININLIPNESKEIVNYQITFSIPGYDLTILVEI